MLYHRCLDAHLRNESPNFSDKDTMTVRKNLERALGEHEAQYNTLCTHVADIHRDVTAGAVSADGGLLTDHGPQHIQTVIARASQLVDSEKCHFTEYEVFLLLAGIHLHDVGNIHGRKDHQFKSADVAKYLGAAIGRDQIVHRTIVQIASAHTAGRSIDKDTIGKLQPEVYILNNRVRPRLLAAILRFSDELADDRDRTNRYLVETDNVPRSSAVYHAYSYALHSVVINHNNREIELHFEIDIQMALDKLGKLDQEVYLLDEILIRSLKLHRERIYAMSFMRDWISIDAIRVFVQVYGGGLNPVEQIGYRLADGGYPDEPEGGVYGVAPELANYPDSNGARVTGMTLAERVRDHD